MHRRLRLAAWPGLCLLLASCASEEELACVRAREAAEARARELGGAVAVAVLLLLLAVVLLRAPGRPLSAGRAAVAALLAGGAAAPAYLLGVLAGQLRGGAGYACGDAYVLFSERTDTLVAAVAVLTIVTALLAACAGLLAAARSTWRG